jgi:hypothetical protein
MATIIQLPEALAQASRRSKSRGSSIKNSPNLLQPRKSTLHQQAPSIKIAGRSSRTCQNRGHTELSINQLHDESLGVTASCVDSNHMLEDPMLACPSQHFSLKGHHMPSMSVSRYWIQALRMEYRAAGPCTFQNVTNRLLTQPC